MSYLDRLIVSLNEKESFLVKNKALKKSLEHTRATLSFLKVYKICHEYLESHKEELLEFLLDSILEVENISFEIDYCVRMADITGLLEKIISRKKLLETAVDVKIKTKYRQAISKLVTEAFSTSSFLHADLLKDEIRNLKRKNEFANKIVRRLEIQVRDQKYEIVN